MNGKESGTDSEGSSGSGSGKRRDVDPAIASAIRTRIHSTVSGDSFADPDGTYHLLSMADEGRKRLAFLVAAEYANIGGPSAFLADYHTTFKQNVKGTDMSDQPIEPGTPTPLVATPYYNLPYFGDSEYPYAIPTDHAILYGPDCDHPATAEEAARWPKENVHWYTFRGDRHAQFADFEPHTEIYYDVTTFKTWAAVRMAQGLRAVVYSSRANAARAYKMLGNYAPAVHWLITTLDGVERTRASLSIELRTKWDASIMPPMIWGQQIETIGTGQQAWDRNKAFGDWL